MSPTNAYEDDERAAAYAQLELPGTYFLAYRDLPELLSRLARGRRALDFGCGTGRSTRLLASLGFEVVGVDIAAEMIAHARSRDPGGDYRLLEAGSLRQLPPATWDVVLSAFTFDNVPQEQKAALLGDLARLLSPQGILVNLVSAPEIYLHEWASFSTRDFPENRHAGSGDPVQIVITAIADPRPVVDVLCTDADYRAFFQQAGLEVISTHRPLGRPDDPHPWVNEERIAPWVVYLLAPGSPVTSALER
jgi:SAM-dependent methyltransferase